MTINQRVSVPETQGSNIRYGLCQGSANEASRNTRFRTGPGLHNVLVTPVPGTSALKNQGQFVNLFLRLFV